MTEDENILHLLKCVDQHLKRYGFNDINFPSKRWAIREAIRRLTPQPPAPGSVEVKIAVASDGRGSVSACEIALAFPEPSAWEHVLRSTPEPITHKAIVTAMIPPIAIPVVEGEVVV
jgi:hypothetical protein